MPTLCVFCGGGFDIFISPDSFLYIIYFTYFPLNYLSSLQLQTADYLLLLLLLPILLAIPSHMYILVFMQLPTNYYPYNFSFLGVLLFSYRFLIYFSVLHFLLYTTTYKGVLYLVSSRYLLLIFIIYCHPFFLVLFSVPYGFLFLTSFLLLLYF